MEQDPNNLSKKPLTYNNLTDFIKTTRDLLREEQKYEIDLFNQITQQKTIQQIEQQGYGLGNMLIVGEREGFYGKTILTLIKSYHSEKNPIYLPQECKIQVGDDVALMKNNTVIASGVVYKRSGPKLKISIRQVDQQIQDYDYEGTLCSVVLKWNQVTFKRYSYVLQELQEYNLYKNSQIVSKLFPPAHEAHNKRVVKNLVGLENLQLPQMNEQQTLAIKMGLLETVHLIHGPPGTGKTTTVCELIVQAVKRGEKVLACAPSNIAVDNMVQALGKRVKTVRVGNPARIIDKVFQHCLDFLVTQNTNTWKNQVKKLQATRKRIKKATSREQKKKLYFQLKQFQSQIHLLQEQTIEEILNEADVICATNVGAADRVFSKYLASRKFDLVVIDQCGQGLQVSCWIPLLKGKRAVLAGDHKQLPPTVQGLEQTLLSYTLFSRAMDQLSNITSTMLQVQYRMNRLIMGWSNKMFYEGQLIAHKSVQDHLLKELYHNVEENQQVVMMVDTSGCRMGQTGEVNESKMNVGQADVAISLYRKILGYGVQSQHIALLTPYSKQVSLLKSLIQQQNLPQVDVSTVDGIQGREKECIIISLVRSNKNKQIGFLKDWRRMNVAITRARRMLVLIGNGDCISQDHYIGSLVKWIEDHGKVVSALEFENDPLVRFGIGVEDQEDFNIKDEESKSKKKKKNKKKNKGKEISSELNTIPKPSVYEAHTSQQIQSLKEYYRSVFRQVKKDEMIFPGATNFERKLIHEVAEEMDLNHQTSSDKKQIKIWPKLPTSLDQNQSDQEELIEIKPKHRHKNRLYKSKEQIQNESILKQQQQARKLKNIGDKFSNALQSLIGQQQSSQEEIQQKTEEVEQNAIKQEKIQSKKIRKKNKDKKQSQIDQKQQQEDWQSLLNEFEQTQPKKDECFKCNKRITSVTSVKCRFCSLHFCRNHVLAEQHGCDDAAAKQAKSSKREVDRFIEKGSEKIKQKIKEQEEARKKKSNKNEKKK